tara:strand:- start:22 stop:195 length:174 start_codon:yes stop_codon:yes gene_type:complete
MNITKAQYVSETPMPNEPIIRVTIDGIEMTVPQDPDNRHYQAIQEWVAEGNKIEDAD